MIIMSEGTIRFGKGRNEDIREILGRIDADYVGVNGEEYYVEYRGKMMSGIDRAFKKLSQFESMREKIVYVVKDCKAYSGGHYKDFKYSLEYMGDKGYHLVIAVEI